jgi:hypothetical protein
VSAQPPAKPTAGQIEKETEVSYEVSGTESAVVETWGLRCFSNRDAFDRIFQIQILFMLHAKALFDKARTPKMHYKLYCRHTG